MTGHYDQREGDAPGDDVRRNERPHNVALVGPSLPVLVLRIPFVRALEGTYSHLYQSLVDEPRVYSSSAVAWKGGPGLYGKHVISPQHAKVTQSIECHLEVFAPGAYGQKHGHLNSACFYIIKGRGHDVHDGKTVPWKAGDVMIVENGCVHQHFNDDPDNEAIVLVFKAKPLFLFMHLMLQKIVEYPPKTGWEGFKPPADL